MRLMFCTERGLVVGFLRVLGARRLRFAGAFLAVVFFAAAFLAGAFFWVVFRLGGAFLFTGFFFLAPALADCFFFFAAMVFWVFDSAGARCHVGEPGLSALFRLGKLKVRGSVS